MNKIFNVILQFGLFQILKSKKGCFALTLLVVSAVALFLGKLDSATFGIVAGVVASVYNFMQAASDVSGYKTGQSNTTNQSNNNGDNNAPSV